MVVHRIVGIVGLAAVVGCSDDGSGVGDTSTGATTDASMPTTTTTASSTSSTSASSTTSEPTSSSSSTDPSSSTGVDTETGDTTGGSAGDCSRALLCDDFEGYDLGGEPAGPWSVQLSQGTVAVDDTRAVSGTQSIRLTTEGGDGSFRRAYMSIEGAPVFPVAGNVVWGRMMVYLVEAPTGSIHWTNIQGEGDVEGMGFRGLYRYGGQHDKRLMANYETQGVSSDCWQHSQTEIPEGVWTCMEWEFDGPADTMRFWLDGQALDDITVVGSGDGCIGNDTNGQWLAPLFDTMRLGWEHYQQSSIGHELWIDDVALDDERIGCPR